MSPRSTANAHHLRNWLGYVGLVAVVLAVNSWAYLAQRQGVIDRNAERLGQLAEVKAEQIEQRLTDWQRVAQAEASDPEIPMALYAAGTGAAKLTQADRELFTEHVSAWQHVYGVRGVGIFDRGLHPLVTVGDPFSVDPLQRPVEAGGGGWRRGFARGSMAFYADKMGLEILTPLLVATQQTQEVVGYLVFFIDVESSILPLLDWDANGAMAEFLLIEKDGDRAAFIGGMKHRRMSDGIVYLPMNSPRLAAAKALAGASFGSDAIDYRGVPVVFDARAISGTPWILLSKIDQDELIAPTRHIAWVSGTLLVVPAALLAILAFTMIRGGRAEYQKFRTEKKLTHLVDSARDAILLVDAGQRIVLFNHAAEAVFRRSARDTIGRPLSVLVPERARGEHEEHFSRFIATGKTRRDSEHFGDLPALRGDGTEFPAEISISRLSDDQETFCSAIIRDVSERKAAQLSLRESEDRFRGYLERAPIGVLIVDHRGIVVECNAVARELFGHGRPVAVPSVFLAIFLVSDREAVLDDILALPVGSQLEREVQLIRRHTQSIWLWLRAVKLADQRVMIYCEDISDRKSVELALRDSEYRFRSIFDNLPIAAAILQLQWDSAGNAIDYRLVGLNPAFERQLGFAGAQALGKEGSALFGGGSAPNVDIYAEVVSSGVPALFGTYLPVMRRYVEISAFRIDEALFALTFADVTAQREAQEMEKRRAEELVKTAGIMVMGEMATAVAHEVSQPLTSIANYSQGCLSRLERGAVPVPVLREIIGEIALEAARAGKVLREIRRLVQSHEYHPEKEDLHAVIRDVVAFNDVRLSKFALGLRMEFETSEPLWVEADRVLIEIVLLNLMRNAVDAMSDPALSRRELVIRARRLESGMVEVSVIDSGTGIPPESLDKVFDPRFSTKREGIGMGLAITRSVIEIHGGAIRATNNDVGGATFTFTLHLFKE
jgi:PAS domain S-box-containing protein